MDFDIKKTLYEQRGKFTDLAEDHGSLISKLLFYGNRASYTKAKNGDVRKIKFNELHNVCAQAVNIGQMEALEAIYQTAKHTLEDTSLDPTEKIELLFGDIELLLNETARHFTTKYDHSQFMGNISIESMRERYKVAQ